MAYRSLIGTPHKVFDFQNDQQSGRVGSGRVASGPRVTGSNITRTVGHRVSLDRVPSLTDALAVARAGNYIT